MQHISLMNNNEIGLPRQRREALGKGGAGESSRPISTQPWLPHLPMDKKAEPLLTAVCLMY